MEIPYEVTPRRDTGLYNSKVAIWLFLASEVMLFGGLFSAYVFLRIGVIDGIDVPWPVSVQKIWAGFANTLILIASSVFVVLAWLQLKARNWKRYQFWMIWVLVCSAGFMVIKGFEYKYKFTHHGIRLQDNSVLEGEIVDGTDRILFEIDSIDIKLSGGSPGFHHQLVKQETHDGHSELNDYEAKKFFFVTRKGERVEINDLDRFFHEKRRALDEMNAANSRINRLNKLEEKKTEKLLGDGKTAVYEPLPLPFVETADNDVDLRETVTIELAEPTLVHPIRRTVSSYSEENGTLAFNDGSTASGRLVNDKVQFIVHEVDLQMLLPEDLDGSLAWKIIDDADAKKHWMEARNKAAANFERWYQEHEKTMPSRKLQDRIVTVHDVHLGGHGHGHDDHGHDDHGHDDPAEKAPSEKGGPEDDGHDDHAGHDHGDEVILEIDRKDIKFMSNHGPRYHPYYAIYFTMTGLHGLHVIGGALVLAYFTFFGKKLYLKNPEHMANRVEVGGLFWHFVDLVWIFLFPIMYLL